MYIMSGVFNVVLSGLSKDIFVLNPVQFLKPYKANIVHPTQCWK